MKLNIRLGALEFYMVLGSDYRIATHTVQRSCVRMVWRGRLVFSLGPAPEAAV